MTTPAGVSLGPEDREQERARRRYERILDAALDVFSRKGYGAAVEDIAAGSGTSKGGVYFHFPNKQSLFLALLDRVAGLLRSRVEAAVAAEPDPIARADIALQVVLQTFASHRTLSRLFFVEALGAGRQFRERMAAIRGSFVELVQHHLDDAVHRRAIPPLDTAAAARVWFGAVNEVITDWVLTEGSTAAALESAYPTVRALLLRGIGAQLSADPAAHALASSSPLPSEGGDGHRTAAVPTLGESRWTLPDVDGRLRAVLEEARRRARERGRPVVASAVFPAPPIDPLLVFARGEGVARDRLFWARPRAGYSMAGVGSASTLAATASAEDEGAARAFEPIWRRLCSDAVVDAPADTFGVGPLLTGGFAFDPQRPSTPPWSEFASGGKLVLPRYLLTVVDGAHWLTVNAVVEANSYLDAELEQARLALPQLLARPGPAEGPEARPHGTGTAVHVAESVDADAWKGLVRSVADEISRSGQDLEKVVLARAVTLRSPDGPFDEVGAVRRLRTDFPSCFVFAFASDGHCFLGATPERLVRLRDKLVSTMCLAGSIRRGATEAEDRELGDALLASEKERHEHALVVRGLRAALAEVCDEIAPVSTPVLLKVRNVQHLLTTVVGRVKDGRTILDVVHYLHPTAAVGGLPSETALRVIREREGLDRGWYAGPIGWLDARGEGEFAVALRCALVRDDQATLFAGCGIVADSDPQAEYAESRLKLQPMLQALGGGEA